MQTIRGRLATWYTVAMGATLFVFAAILYLVQRSQTFSELDSRARLESDLIAAILAEAHRAREVLIGRDPDTGRPVLGQEVTSLLDGVPGLVAVLGPDGNVLFLSPDARALSFGALSRLVAMADAPEAAEGSGSVSLGGQAGQVRYFVRRVTEAGPEIGAVISGVPTAGLVLGPERLLTAMLVIAPFIIVASTGIGYFLVGRTLKPVDKLVDEVEAITDGRSLHRRLADPTAHDELARLSTTLNEMLGRLERSFRMLRRFTADASHELKTPLTVLRSGIERSITHPATPPEVMELLEETLVEVNRMAEMVDSLLTLARADEGRAPLHLDEVDLRDVLGEVAETAGILGEDAGVEVSVGVPAERVVVQVDRSRLRQLLLNLLTNAIKYTPRGGTVWIQTGATGNQLVLTVGDTGIGIAPGDLPQIFDRFWRADPARSRQGATAGAGLGLAICKWIAEAHGGSIAVQSRPGRGTSFTIRLPVVVSGTVPERAALSQ